MDSKLILSVYIVDDEPAALRNLKTQLEKFNNIKIVGFEKYALLANRFLSNENNIPDVVFLDIEMQGMDGLELAMVIKDKTMIIFTTAHDNYAVISYEFGAVDYLLKPFSSQRLQESILKCFARKRSELLSNEEKDDDYFLINDSNTHSKVKLRKDNIFYIAVVGNYVEMYKEDGSCVMPKLSLSKALEIFSDGMFLRIHKSYAINKKQVMAVAIDHVKLNNNTILPIGRKYKNIIKNIQSDNLGL